MITTRVLDRKPYFDPRSIESYAIRGLIGDQVSRTRRIWNPPTWALDQGQEGHCVGFGWAGELAGSPIRVPGVDNQEGHRLFFAAQAEDRKMGNYWDDGASVLAGAKAVSALGHMDEYRWARGIDDVIDTLVAHGPVVLGIPWLDGMYHTRRSGLVDVSGRVAGGHCIVAYGYHPRLRIRGESWLKRFEVVYWRNSWGQDYGMHGSGFVPVADLERLLKMEGEACVPVHRLRGGKLA